MPAPAPAGPSVASQLGARFERFAQLTAQGHDLVDSLKQRRIAVRPPHDAATAGVEEYCSTLPFSAPQETWARPTHDHLHQQALRDRADLERLRAAFPHLRSQGAFHSSG